MVMVHSVSCSCEVDVIHELAAGEKIALEVFHPRLDLAFGQGRQLHGIGTKRRDLFA